MQNSIDQEQDGIKHNKKKNRDKKRRIFIFEDLREPIGSEYHLMRPSAPLFGENCTPFDRDGLRQSFVRWKQLENVVEGL